jgi:hypothetical protein
MMMMTIEVIAAIKPEVEDDLSDALLYRSTVDERTRITSLFDKVISKEETKLYLSQKQIIVR